MKDLIKGKKMKREKYLGIITADVVTASEEASAFEIACMMDKHNIGAVVVMSGEKVMGIISERDIARKVVAKKLCLDTTKAKDFMTKDAFCAELKDGLNAIYKTLCEMKFRHLVMLDNGKLIGITSRRDLLDGLSGVKR